MPCTDIDQLKATLTSIQEQKTDICICFVQMTASKTPEKAYKGWMLNVAVEELQELYKQSIQYILSQISKYNNSVEYDVEVQEKDKLSWIAATEVPNSEIITQLPTINQNESNTLGEDSPFAQIEFIVIKVKIGDKFFYIFKKFFKSKKFATSRKYYICGSVMKPVTKEIVSISNSAFAFLFDGRYYILNEGQFDSSFKFTEHRKQFFENHMESIRNCDFIAEDDIGALLEAIGRNNVALRRTCKALSQNSFTLDEQAIHRIPSVIEEFHLKITTVDGGYKIRYEGKKNELNDILTLVLDKCVKTALTNTPAVATTIQPVKES